MNNKVGIITYSAMQVLFWVWWGYGGGRNTMSVNVAVVVVYIIPSVLYLLWMLNRVRNS